MKPTLFVLAAGMGSRYGGLKQLDPIGPSGETIMDYSIYDAIRAGFGKIVFVIRRDFQKDFEDKILSKYTGHIPVETVFQSVDALPEGFTAPADRVKPWGTGQAILMGAPVINEPFAVINADDFYGEDAFRVLAKELTGISSDEKGRYSMVGFRLGNTLTENGTVSRGICRTDSNDNLTSVVERTSIGYNKDGEIVYTEDDRTEHPLSADDKVSMNFWGFTPDLFPRLKEQFRDFLEKNIDKPKSEFYIPTVVQNLIDGGVAEVKVLPTTSRWFGVTYSEDRPKVVAQLARLVKEGKYPTPLFKQFGNQ